MFRVLPEWSKPSREELDTGQSAKPKRTDMYIALAPLAYASLHMVDIIENKSNRQKQNQQTD